MLGLGRLVNGVKSIFGAVGKVGDAAETVGGAVETFQKELSHWKEYVVWIAQMVGFLAGSISAFFVGLFLSVGGLHYFLLIDKGSLLASLFIYTAVLSCLTMIVSFIPRLIASKGLVLWAARALGLVGFSVYIIGVEYTIFLSLLAAVLLLWVWLRPRNREESPSKALHAPPAISGQVDPAGHAPRTMSTEERGSDVATSQSVPKRRRLSHLRHDLEHLRHDLELLKVVTSVLLFCCFVFGYLRGEYLREQPPSMIINPTDAARPAVRVTVIMSSGQGVLVFEAANPEPRFYPWDKISSMTSAPEQGGIRQRLRHWRDAVRAWMSGTAAVVRGWLG
jgi:hypothetical protein